MLSYETISTRMDGFSPSIYEFSTPMFFAAVFAADLFVGFNTLIWTWWVFFAVAIGIVLVWIFGVCPLSLHIKVPYSQCIAGGISGSLSWLDVNHSLWQ
jgi:hypothetical protein